MLWVILIAIAVVLALPLTASAASNRHTISADGEFEYSLDIDGNAHVFKVQNLDLAESYIFPSEIDGHPLKSINGNLETIDGKWHRYSCFHGTEAMWITSITVPEGVEDIGGDAFYNTELERVVLPDSIKEIEAGAFEDCPNLTQINIPDSLVMVGEEAFAGCSNLAEVDLRENVTYVGIDAFHKSKLWNDHAQGVVYAGKWALGIKGKCPSTIKIKSGTVGISEECFENKPMSKVMLPQSLIYINEGAFSECGKLAKINIPGKLKIIPEDAFSYSGLKTIAIPKSVTSIGENAFTDCTKLSKIKIKNPNVSIGSDAFLGTAYVDSKKASTGAIYIGKHLVSHTWPNSKKPVKLKIKAGTRNIADGALDSWSNWSKLVSVSIPKSVTRIGRNVFDRRSVKTIVVNKKNKVYDSRKKCNAVIHKKTRTLVFGCQNTIIPDSVRCIGECAFKGTIGLKKITIPKSVTAIEEGAFAGCTHLKSVKIPDSVNSIGATAFGGCVRLKSVKIPGNIREIESGTFSGCGFTSITVPGSIERIGYGAFSECENLTKLTIKPGVQQIEPEAFIGCPKLKSVTIPSSVTWIDSYAFGYKVDEDGFPGAKIKGFTIYGKAGSEAEAYAKDEGFTFVAQ